MNRLWYAIGVLLVLAGLVHLGVFVVDGGPWEGAVSWRKPFTFGVSFGLSVLTLTWVARFVRVRARAWLVGAFAVASTVEVTLISLQTWRGVPSHFNMETAFDTAVARSLAAGGGVLIAIAITMTIAAFRPDPTPTNLSPTSTPGPGPGPQPNPDRWSDSRLNARSEPGLGLAPSMRLAVRAGFATLIVAVTFGGIMIARGVVEVMTGHQRLAYTVAVALKPAHAVFMHGVLLLPALAWLLAHTSLSEPQRLRMVRLATWTYVTSATAVSALAVAGLTPVSASTASVLCAGAISGLAIATLVLGRIQPAGQQSPLGRRHHTGCRG
ncbi:hypothetical protein [Nonomuraea sp. NPDC049709]|uniref:hypothetical protein n=1 Tax=Nonomuraea sp. NPDC049709 TaxID=3154736 RepID=UPI00343D6AB0